MPSIHRDPAVDRPAIGAFGLGVALMSPFWAAYAASVTAGLSFWSMARAAGLAHGTRAEAADEIEPGAGRGLASPVLYEPGDESVREIAPPVALEPPTVRDETLVPAEVVAGEPLVVAEAVAAPRKRRKVARAAG